MQKPTPLRSSGLVTWIFANHTKICTSPGSMTKIFTDDLDWLNLHLIHGDTFLLMSSQRKYAYMFISARRHGMLSGSDLSVIHFRGYRIRQVSCYTLPRWTFCFLCRLPWPQPWYQYTDTLFGYLWIVVRPLKHANGWPRLTSSAYQRWSTRLKKLE